MIAQNIRIVYVIQKFENMVCLLTILQGLSGPINEYDDDDDDDK